MIFMGIKDDDGNSHVMIDNNNGEKTELYPDKSLKIINHSPTGFSWGYKGSGPAQLALAILLSLLPQDDALKLYKLFKDDVIAELPEASFRLDSNNVLKWAQNKLAEL
jgi:hypothetical protein